MEDSTALGNTLSFLVKHYSPFQIITVFAQICKNKAANTENGDQWEDLANALSEIKGPSQ